MGLRDLSDRRVRLGTLALITAAVLAAVMTLAARSFFASDPPTTAVDAQTPPKSVEVRATVPKPNTELVQNTESNLVINQQTRLNIEQLVALHTPDEMQTELQKTLQTLPPAAAQRFADLVERYVTYADVVRQTFPPGEAPANEDEALAQISMLHDLRAQHFGPDTAQALFGTEERVQRELLQLMQLEKDPTLTLQQRAEKAQAHYQRLSRLEDGKD